MPGHCFFYTIDQPQDAINTDSQWCFATVGDNVFNYNTLLVVVIIIVCERDLHVYMHSSAMCMCGNQKQLCRVGFLFSSLCGSSHWGFAQQVSLPAEISPVHLCQLSNNVHSQSCKSSVLMIICHYFSPKLRWVWVEDRENGNIFFILHSAPPTPRLTTYAQLLDLICFSHVKRQQVFH